jgi:hypothetical protein
VVPQWQDPAADPVGAQPGSEGRVGAAVLLLDATENDTEAILAEVIKRWPIEVPFAEARAHLGVETPRHWSDRAIARETPCLFGLSSLVALIGRALHQEHPLAIRTSAWYPKPQATFSDVLAAVRRHCGNGLDIRTSDRDPRCVEIPRPQWESLINSVCYAH